VVVTSASSSESSSSASTTAKPIVFVVDDDVSVRESLELLIRSAGWEPKTFATAQAFLSRSREFVPSCLILDVNIAGINGFDLLENAAADLKGVPVVVISGYDSAPLARRASTAGAFELLTKPFSSEFLLGAIGRAIERSR
jgi:FixJ family two-component response regulator